MNTQPPRAGITGFQAFLVVWSGQVLSMTGSAMSQFALSIWAYEKTGLATSLAMVEFFFQGAMILATPLAGVWVDRWNRRLTMMLSDLLAVSATIGILLLHRFGYLAIWHLYVAGVINGIGQAFQWPAYSAAITQMVPKEQYARAGGLMSLAESGSIILAPILAGLLIGTLGVDGILLIDIVTFGFAFSALLMITVPSPVPQEKQQQESMLRQTTFGFRYIVSRTPLLCLLTIYAVTNFVTSIGFPLLTPMVLARTGNDVKALAMVLSAAGIGGVLGGLLMGAWGGPRRRIQGILLGNTINFGLMGVMVTLGRNPVWWAAGFLIGQCLGTMVNGLSQSIWQVKVPVEVQGRVFATRRLISSIIAPLGLAISGPLADRVFEPAMAGGWLPRVAAPLAGTGAGAGMSLIFFGCCILATLASLSGFVIPAVRNLETLIPDNDTTEPRSSANEDPEEDREESVAP